MKSVDRKKRIGLIVPSSNTMMERDYVPRVPNNKATLHVARMYLKGATRQEEEDMVNKYMPQAALDLASADVDVVLFGCTSAGTLHGKETEQELEQSIQKQAGVPGITVTKSIDFLLQEMGARKIVVLSPYIDDLNQSVRNWLTSVGYEVVLSNGMGLVLNSDIASVKSEDIVKFTMESLEKNKMLRSANGKKALVGADAILYSCTNFPSWESLPLVQKELDTKFLTSNQAMFDYTLKYLKLQ